MRNDYSYDDPDYQYTGPKTGILRNIQNITDRDMLNLLESGASTKRANELLENPIIIVARLDDCRICQLPNKEIVADYFRWRNEDANRNALNAHCYWLLRKNRF